MSVVRRVSCLTAIGLAAGLLAATGAFANTTFYVNGTSGNDKNACTSAGTACKTIPAAVAKVEEDTEGEADTIEVAAGVYQEVVELHNPSASGITINGAGSGPGGTEIEGPEKASAATVVLETFGGSAALSNLSVVNDKKEDEHEGIVTATNATLANVTVTMEDANNKAGISVQELGGLTMRGGGVTMEAGTEGAAITSGFVPVTIEGVSVLLSSGAKGGGIEVEAAPGSISGSVVHIASTAAEDPALIEELSNTTLTNDTIIDNSAKDPALEFALPSGLTVQGVSVSMTNPANTAPAITQEFGAALYDRVAVSGGWSGPGWGAEGGVATFADSHLAAGAGGLGPAVEYFQGAELPGLVIQRSILEASPLAAATVRAANADVTLDSSEVLGGLDALALELATGKVRRLTVAGSTIDAGARGEADAAGVADVALTAAGTNSEWRAMVEGSILLEPQTVLIGPKAKAASIRCAYSDTPDQVQAASATEGAIQCANGSEGNTHTAPGALFSAPVTEYRLNPASSAVDSVPASAIALPFGLTPSSTDLAGNPRVLDGNGDCAAVQDKGALELQGHAATCPILTPPPSPEVPKILKPHPALSALKLSPSAFSAAVHGASISKAGGTKVSYVDSETATSTFTVFAASGGRIQGRSCVKPGRHNRRGKRCTRYVALGTFTHADAAGANSFHFSGRLKGRKLARGLYKLQAIATNGNGKSLPVAVAFSIK